MIPGGYGSAATLREAAPSDPKIPVITQAYLVETSQQVNPPRQSTTSGSRKVDPTSLQLSYLEEFRGLHVSVCGKKEKLGNDEH